MWLSFGENFISFVDISRLIPMTLPSIVLSKAHAGVVFMLVVGPDALKVAVALAEIVVAHL